jgi:hypothetical protein
MRHHRRRVIPGSLLLTLFLWAVPAKAEDSELEWLVVTSDRFSLAAEYPAALFHDLLMTYGLGDNVWFGPNRDGATLLISARPAGDQKPYDSACSLGCSNVIDAVDKPGVGAVLGKSGNDDVYYSECVLATARDDGSTKEMHCFHIIFPTSSASTYTPIVDQMSATLR